MFVFPADYGDSQNRKESVLDCKLLIYPRDRNNSVVFPISVNFAEAARTEIKIVL